MRLAETRLRRLIRSLLVEAVPPPDEPRVAPDEAMGRYAFPGDRTDPEYAQVPEDNTALEDKFYQALVNHYDKNDHSGLREVWPELIELVRAGLYPKLLTPPRGPVFRLLTADPARAAQILGVDEEALVARPGVARRAESPPVYSPRGFISSWTLDPETMVEHTSSQFLSYKSGHCTVLLVAETSGGEFMMNPESFARGWKLGSNYQLEYEVIAGGPVGLKSAAWLWHGDGPRGRFNLNTALGMLGKLLAAVGEE